MNFPAYVPAVVRTHLSHYLEGENERSIPGYADLLESEEKRLIEIERTIEARTRRGEIELVALLRKQRADSVEHRDRLARDVDCLRRLAHDRRMQEVFALLTREFTDDQQWRSFVHCAWAAKIDFSKFRESRKLAIEVTAKIADAAETLANLIRQFEDAGISAPSEFYSIPELLRQTDNHDMQDHNLAMWRVMRPHLLGDLPRRDVREIEKPNREGEQSRESIVVTRTFLEPGEKPDIDPIQQQLEDLRYAWGTAPDLSALLETLAAAARGWKPGETGFIAAAIESRQRSAKTEYLRAFGSLLIDRHNVNLTTAIMQAMAIAANVVINLPDVDVTYDDVRKALARIGGG